MLSNLALTAQKFRFRCKCSRIRDKYREYTMVKRAAYLNDLHDCVDALESHSELDWAYGACRVVGLALLENVLADLSSFFRWPVRQ